MKNILASKVILEDGVCTVTVENDSEKEKTMLGINSWSILLTNRDDVESLIALLNKGLEFWEY